MVLPCRSRREAGHVALRPAGSPFRIGARAIGHPQLVALREADAHGHHADDGERAAVQDDALAHDGGIAAETPLEEPVAQEDHGLVPEVLSFLLAEVAAQRGMEAEQGEEVGRDRAAA